MNRNCDFAMGGQVESVVTSRFTWGRCVAEYLQLYDELLTSPVRNLGVRS